MKDRKFSKNSERKLFWFSLSISFVKISSFKEFSVIDNHFPFFRKRKKEILWVLKDVTSRTTSRRTKMSPIVSEKRWKLGKKDGELNRVNVSILWRRRTKFYSQLNFRGYHHFCSLQCTEASPGNNNKDNVDHKTIIRS